MSDREKVFIVECAEYDTTKIRSLIERGMKETGFVPKGKVFAKPNAVTCIQPERYGRHAVTDPNLVQATLEALAGHSGVSRIDLGENSAIGVPTRLAYRNAGYFDIVKRLNRNGSSIPVKAVCIDEHKRTPVFMGGAVHDRIRINKQMAEADTMVYMPRLKCHCVSKMTCAVKLNIGILGDDERAIRHDFSLNQKIADLLLPGSPDFVVVDAIEVGVGNEAMPIPRHMGLLIMSKSAIAVDVVGAHLLGMKPDEIPYLKAAFDRGYGPKSLDELNLIGDITSAEGIQKAAERVKPYDDDFYRWQNVSKELKRMNSPLRFYHGPHSPRSDALCETGCVMGVKMFLGFMEKYAGVEGFANARPQPIVIGRVDEPIDAKGDIAWLFGSCTKAKIENAKKVVKVDKCFTTAADMYLVTRQQMGIPSPFFDKPFLKEYVSTILAASGSKLIKGRYFQDIGNFMFQHLSRRV